MNNCRRINFYAGAGAGKSTTAAWIFAQLKALGLQCEQITEYIKTWAYEGKLPKSWDQVFLFANQLRREDVVLSSGTTLVISDSPLLMSCCYGMMTASPAWRSLVNIAHEFEKQYPSVNIMLKRGDWVVDPNGRYLEDEGVHSDMGANDDRIRRFVLDHLDGIPLYEVDARDWNGCMEIVLKGICFSA